MTTGRREVIVGAVAVVALVAAVVVATTTGDGGELASTTAPASRTGDEVERPARHTGPQGDVGQFVVHCDYDHSARADPIVLPGDPGASHRHDFYGATGVDAFSTADNLVGDGTTCDKTADTASYWQPSLLDDNEVVTPLGIDAYYRAAPGVAPTQVETMPVGLALIAGDQTASTPQPGEATGWTCGVETHLSDDPPICPAGAPLHLVLTFPDCWDGEHLRAGDHKAHAAYSDDGSCPQTHPVHIPQLTVSVGYPISGPDHDLGLASGTIYSAHGDFLNAWQPAGLRREIEGCIHRGAVCDLASDRGQEAPFS